MRMSKRFWMLHATTIVAALAACGINDRHDAPKDLVTVRTYTDVNGDVPPFAGNLGTTYCTSRAGWNCLIHPDIEAPAYNETAERITRVVVHELGHTLAECGKFDPNAHNFSYGCYMLDSDATLEGLPPICSEEAEMARKWATGHGSLRVEIKDAWLRQHTEKAVKIWNDGAGITIFTIKD